MRPAASSSSERQPVEPLADLADRLLVLRGGEVGRDGACASANSSSASSVCERRQRVLHLARELER